MERARRIPLPPAGAEILDFDEALLGACAPQFRARLLTEAAMLAEAFAPRGRAEQLRAMAQTLCSDQRDGGMSRARARRLAAALRHLARHAQS